MHNDSVFQNSANAHLVRFLSLVALAAGIVSVGMSILVWTRFHIDIPVRDIAVLLPLIRTAVQDGLAATQLGDWFALHSGAHRIVFGRMFAYLDYAFFSGKNLAIYLSLAVSLLVMVWVFYRAAREQLSQGWEQGVLVLGLVLLFLCSPLQYWNLIEPLCATWYYSGMFSALALWLLVSEGENLTPAAAFTVALLCVGAAFSNFSGVILCLLLPVLAFLVRSPYWLHMMVVLALFSLAYVFDLQTDHSNPDIHSEEFLAELTMAIRENPGILQGERPGPDIIGKVIYIVRSTLLHFGYPFSKYAPVLGAALASLSFLLLAWSWLVLVVRRFRPSAPFDALPPAMIFLLALATLQVVISSSIWFGRADVNHPFAPRYQGITVIYWLSVVLLMLCEVNRRWPVRFPAAAVAVTLFGILLSVATIVRPVAPFEEKYRHVQEVGLLHRLQVEAPAPLLEPKYRRWQSILEQETAFVAAYNLPLAAGITSRELTAGQDVQSCDDTRLRFGPTAKPLVQRIDLVSARRIGFANTRLFLVGANGQVGALYPAPPRTLYPQALLAYPETWHGYFKGHSGAATYYLVIDRGGQLASCSIKPESV
jgi:hypothetical protein